MYLPQARLQKADCDPQFLACCSLLLDRRFLTPCHFRTPDKYSTALDTQIDGTLAEAYSDIRSDGISAIIGQARVCL